MIFVLKCRILLYVGVTMKPSVYDYYKKLSVQELNRKLEYSLGFIEKHPEFTYGRINEYCGILKMIIAEKIGKR